MAATGDLHGVGAPAPVLRGPGSASLGAGRLTNGIGQRLKIITAGAGRS